jgi:hypothetical protein
VANVTKRYVVQVAAHNLGLLMRKLFEVGKPRALQGAGGLLAWAACWLCWPRGLYTSRSHGRRGTCCPNAAA